MPAHLVIPRSAEELRLTVSSPTRGPFSRPGEVEIELRWISVVQEDGSRTDAFEIRDCVLEYGPNLGQLEPRQNKPGRNYDSGYAVDRLRIGIPVAAFEQIKTSICRAISAEESPIFPGHIADGYHWIVVRAGQRQEWEARVWEQEPEGNDKTLRDPFRPLRSKVQNILADAILTTRLKRVRWEKHERSLPRSQSLVPWTFAMTLVDFAKLANTNANSVNREQIATTTTRRREWALNTGQGLGSPPDVAEILSRMGLSQDHD